MTSISNFRVAAVSCLFFVSLLIGTHVSRAQEGPGGHCKELGRQCEGETGLFWEDQSAWPQLEECMRVKDISCVPDEGDQPSSPPSSPPPPPPQPPPQPPSPPPISACEQGPSYQKGDCTADGSVQKYCEWANGCGHVGMELCRSEKGCSSQKEELLHDIPSGCEEQAKAAFERCHVIEDGVGRGECMRVAVKRVAGAECAEGHRWPKKERRPDGPSSGEGPCFPFDVRSDHLVQRWIEEVAMRHGEQFTHEEVLALPRCAMHRPPGPPGGPPGPGGPHVPPGGGGVGEVFGRAVGMLVELSAQERLPEGARQKVREALEWFSGAISDIAGGEGVGGYVLEAKEKLRSIMELMRQSGPGWPGEGPGHVADEIRRNLEMMQKMVTDMIPRALTMAEQMGHDVSSLHDYLERLRAKLGDIRAMCETAKQDSGREQLEQCFRAMEELGREMERMGHEAESIIPHDDMRIIEEEIGFEEGEPQGPSSDVNDDFGPPGDMHPRDMVPEGFDARGAEIPDHLRRAAKDCMREKLERGVAQWDAEAECHRSIMREMFGDFMEGGGVEGVYKGFGPEVRGMPPSGPRGLPYDGAGHEQMLDMIRGDVPYGSSYPDRMPPIRSGESFPPDRFEPHPQGGYYPMPPYREREENDWEHDFMNDCIARGDSPERCEERRRWEQEQ